MKLEPLTLDQCQKVRIWRNECLETLRTPYPLTESQQEAFYRDVVCDRNSPHRYFAIVREVSKEDYIKSGRKDIKWEDIIDFAFIGMGGIANIDWINRIGEISLIIDPERRGKFRGEGRGEDKGEGEKAADLLLDQAFNYLNLQTVYGECYWCNEAAKSFWRKISNKYFCRETYNIGDMVTNCVNLPNRKFWKGRYYNSLYFSIDKDDFNNVKSNS